MKIQLITLFAAFVLGSGIANSTLAAIAKNETATVLTDLTAVNKIEVRGNVELYISAGATDQVKVYNKYYAESALVKSRNGILTITSYKPEKLVVWVTAADLRCVSVYDNAEVKTFGDFSSIEFFVDLHDNSSAKLSLDAFTANITVKDNAKATLSGRVNNCDIKYDNPESVAYENFDAVHSSKVQTGTAVVVNIKSDSWLIFN